MSTIELNNLIIDERIEAGIALLRQHFTVEEKKVDPALASPIIGGRPHHARRFNVEGIGNLLVMTVKDVPENQLSAFIITPYERDLPLFSTDYVYSGERRFFLIELYDLAATHDSRYHHGIDVFAKLSTSWDDMPDFRTQSCWYDEIRAVCIAKTPTQDQDSLALQRFQEALGCYIDMAQTLPTLTREQQREKWRLNKGYSDRLIDEGGVSTDLFTQALGPENTRRFFDEVFFASACYGPILVSACLLGEPCRYDGASQPCKAVIEMAKTHELVPVCPEQMGGLPTPRMPSEIQLDGRVVDAEGVDRTTEFEAGAREALRIAQARGCMRAILKENSPSCGSHCVYDGTFSGTLVPGKGKTAALLASAGIDVISEADLSTIPSTSA